MGAGLEPKSSLQTDRNRTQQRPSKNRDMDGREPLVEKIKLKNRANQKKLNRMLQFLVTFKNILLNKYRNHVFFLPHVCQLFL